MRARKNKMFIKFKNHLVNLSRIGSIKQEEIENEFYITLTFVDSTELLEYFKSETERDLRFEKLELELKCQSEISEEAKEKIEKVIHEFYRRNEQTLNKKTAGKTI
jgi:hypothetical protein